MLLQIVKSSFFAALLAWAMLHFTESMILSGVAACVLMALRMLNLVPFATVAVPVVLVGVMVLRDTDARPVQQAVSAVQNQISLVSVALAQRPDPATR